jgi:hypothetical protein
VTKAANGENLAARDLAMRQKLRASMKKRWGDPRQRRGLTAAIKKAMDLAVREKISRSQRERWARWRAARADAQESGGE